MTPALTALRCTGLARKCTSQMHILKQTLQTLQLRQETTLSSEHGGTSTGHFLNSAATISLQMYPLLDWQNLSNLRLLVKGQVLCVLDSGTSCLAHDHHESEVKALAISQARRNQRNEPKDLEHDFRESDLTSWSTLCSGTTANLCMT